MANRKTFKLSKKQRQSRRFSESFKKQRVAEIEQKRTSVSEISRRHEVNRNAIYKWIAKYGQQGEKSERLVVELESDSLKLLEAEKKISELERALGQKQMQLQFMEKMVSIAEKKYGFDLKKTSKDRH